MAMRAATTTSGLGTNEHSTVATVMRVITDVVSAVGEGMRARNEYCALVGQGTDPVQAAATAMRHTDQH